MNLEDYRSTWQTAGTVSTARTEMEALIHNMTRSEQRNRNLMRIFVFNSVAAFLLVLGVVILRRPIAWNELGPALGLQLILALALAQLIRRGQARRRALASAALTVRAAAEQGLGNVNSQVRDIRLLFCVAAVAVPLLALSVSQLMASGKMNSQAAFSFSLICTLVLGLNAAFQWYRYRTVLAPRRGRLEQLLASLGDEA